MTTQLANWTMFRRLANGCALSRPEIAKHIGVSVGCVRHWLNGTRPVPLYALNAMIRLHQTTTP